MADRLKIGLFVDAFFPMIDGVVYVLHNHAKRLSTVADVTVFCPHVPKKAYNDDIYPYKVVRCKAKKMFFTDYDMPTPNLDFKFKKIIKESKFDIVHVHSPFGVGALGAKYAKKNNIPLITTLHSQFKRDIKRAAKSSALTWLVLKILMRTLNKSDLLLTMTPGCEQVARKYGYKKRIELLPNGPEIVPPVNREEAFTRIRQKYSIGREEFVLISLGRLNKLKNVHFILDVVKKLKCNKSPVKLLLIGTGSDEGYLRKKSKKQNIEDCVIFTGRISDADEKAAHFAAADLNIFPSFYDMDSLVKSEAAACGVPTIFVEGSVAATAVSHGINGYAGKNNIAEFAGMVEEIIKNPAKNAMIAQKAKETLVVSWDDIVKELFKKYKNEIENKAKALKNIKRRKK